jgi:putative FmdB family regulatory protein
LPLYEYQCDACGHRFEVIQKFSDALIATCVKCGAGPVQKLISSPAIQFKGSGWYITDYARAGKSDGAGTGDKSDKSGDAASGESKTASTSESSSEGKGETKAVTKSETKSESKPESKPPATSS